MARKSKPEIKFVCEKCGETPEVNKEMSNENWKVFPTVCKCGGKVVTKFE